MFLPALYYPLCTRFLAAITEYSNSIAITSFSIQSLARPGAARNSAPLTAFGGATRRWTRGPMRKPRQVVFEATAKSATKRARGRPFAPIM